MAPARNKKRANSILSLGDDDFEEIARGGKKAVRGNDSWDVWQDTVRTQEADRVKQYMSTFQEKVASVRKKIMQDLRKSEEKRLTAESRFLDNLKAAYGKDHSDTVLPLRTAGSEVLGLLQAMLARFEQTKQELQAQCKCPGGQNADLMPQVTWDKDHAEARKLLHYGRAYGDSLVREIIVPKGRGSDGSGVSGAATLSPVAHPDSVDLDRTGRSAVGLFPRSRAVLVGGQTWGETAQTQMRAFSGLIQTLPSGERSGAVAAETETVSFMDC